MRRAALTFILMLLAQGCSAQTGLYLIALMASPIWRGAESCPSLLPAFPQIPRRSGTSPMPKNGSLPRSPSTRPKVRSTSFRSVGAGG